MTGRLLHQDELGERQRNMADLDGAIEGFYLKQWGGDRFPTSGLL